MKKLLACVILSLMVLSILSGCGMLEDGMITSSPMPTMNVMPSSEPTPAESMMPSSKPDMGTEKSGTSMTPSESTAPSGSNTGSTESR